MSSTYAHRHINFMAMRENFAMIWKTFHIFINFLLLLHMNFASMDKSHDDAVLWVRERFEWVNRKRRKSEEEEEKLSLTDRRSETENDKKSYEKWLLCLRKKFMYLKLFLNAARMRYIFIFY